MKRPRPRWVVLNSAVFLVVVSVVAASYGTALNAFSYVIDSNGTYWGIQDDDSPRVDTGSTYC